MVEFDPNNELTDEQLARYKSGDDGADEVMDEVEFQEKIKAPYIQVFPGDENYQESLSILDAIFCEGPMARNLILPTKN